MLVRIALQLFYIISTRNSLLISIATLFRYFATLMPVAIAVY